MEPFRCHTLAAPEADAARFPPRRPPDSRQVTGQEHPHQPVPLLTFPLTTPAAAMFPTRAW